MKRIFSLVLALISVPILHAQVAEVDLTRKDLYVKTDGTGDGSSWENAMDPQSFAYYLSKANDGTTFYVAEGTYYPMYDSYGRLSTGAAALSAVFTVNSDVTIKGGFPASAKTGAVSDPSLYKTTFTGDFGKDDVYTVDKDKDGNYYLEVENYTDNSSVLFLVRPSVTNSWISSYTTPVFDETDKENYFRLDGVTVKGVNGWNFLCAGLNLELNLSNSTVENGSGIYMVQEHPTFIADKCYFINLASQLEFITPETVNVSNSMFNGCGTFTVVNSDDAYTSKVNLDNDRFRRSVYSNGTIELNGICDFVLKNTGFNDIKMTGKLVSAASSNMLVENCSVSSVKAEYELFYTCKSAKFKNCSIQDNESRIFLDNCTNQSEKVEISNCLFQYNDFSYSFFNPTINASITNNTFLYNSCESWFIANSTSSFDFSNNSVIGNSSKHQGFYISNPNFYNNTILGNEFDGGILEFGSFYSEDEPTTCNLYGNIILGNAAKLGTTGYENIPVIKNDVKNIDYNLISIIRTDYQEEGEEDNTTWMPKKSNNIFVRPFDLGTDESSKCKVCAAAYPEFEYEVLSQIFDGKYTSKDHVFDVELDSKTSLPVARLKTNRLADGAALLFPLKNTIVKTDELGTERSSYTAMGAVEKPCASDTTFVTDTVLVGSTFEGKKYNNIGIYDNIKVALQNKYGCDSVVNHTLIVLPDPKVKEFYVKKKATGKGDGSNWNNAMSSEDFTFVFNNSKVAGVSYYVAAGVYYSGKLGWNSVHGANIYGGYDSLAVGDASTTKANPSMYRTVFSGDINNDDKPTMLNDCDFTFGTFSDNLKSTMFFMTSDCDIHVSGIEMTGMTFTRGSSPTLFAVSPVIGKESEYSVTIDHCRFTNADKGVTIYKVKNASFDNCEFEYILNSAIGANSKCHIANCTFAYTKGINYYGVQQDLVLENSTFVKNPTDLFVSGDKYEYPSSVNVFNNTFISCASGSYFSIEDDVVATVTGNIFVGSKVMTLEGGQTGTQTYSNNLFAYKSMTLGESGVEKNNITLEDASELYTSIFDGKYSKEDDIFTPNLKNNGGYTRTVALLKDELSDGSKIRFSKLKDVAKDQCGVDRLDMTCMGAYEMKACGGDTTFVVDSVIVGTKFNGELYNVGRHDSIFVTTTSEKGCDQTVCYTLFVKPDPKVLNYYVKTKKTGKGDGSDWDNAMDGTDFAAYLALAPDDVTFYVAEGTYKPVYNASLLKSNVTSTYQYSINGSVTIRGGYPADAKGKTAVFDPKKYKTIFDGDINGDDVINDSLKASNRKDNASCLFYRHSQKFEYKHAAFDGVTIMNSNYGVYYLNEVALVEISNSEFIYNDCAAFLPYAGDTLKVNNSTFSKNFTNVVYMPQASNLFMDSVLFEKNLGTLINIPATPGVNPGYNVSLNHIFAYGNGSGSEIINSIGHDFVLSNSVFKDNNGSITLIDNSRIDNSTFEMNNGGITKYGTGSFVINECSFVDNTNKGYFVYVANAGDDPCYFGIINSSFKNTDSKGLIWVSNDSISIENSEFSGSTQATIQLSNYGSANISRSYFSENKGTNFYFSGKSISRYENLLTNFYGNTLWKNECGDGNLIDFTSAADSVVIANNTFVSNESSKLIEFHGCKPEMYNNTILGNINTSYVINANPGDLKLEGNIILGNSVNSNENISNVGTEAIYSRWSKIDYKNNILPCVVDMGDVSINNIDETVLKNNIVSIFDNTNVPEDLSNIANRNNQILTTLFKGTYDAKTGLFTPTLEKAGVLTPVVALNKDALADGTSIRFPRLANVLYDQRGEDRLSNTCMGSYELKCTSDTTFMTDTIIVGTEFHKVIYDKVGRHDSVTVVVPNKNGCDDVVSYTLFVVPDPNILDYYVKTKKAGKGDGSDWDNAMDGTDFASYLPIVADGVTFHVAEGTYNPVLNANLVETIYPSDRQYTVNSNVTVRGGYPADAKGKNVASDPEKNKTVFDGMVDSSNVYRLFYSNVVRNIDFAIDGAVLKNAEYAVVAFNSKNVPNAAFDVTLSNVSFEDNSSYGVLSYSDKGSVNVNNSSFKNNKSCIYVLHSNVDVTNSTFEKNGSDYLITIMNDADTEGNACGLNIESSSFVENTGSIQTYNELNVTNSLFDSNVISGNFFSAWSGSKFSNFDVDFTYNKFVNNKVSGSILETYSNAVASIDSCNFDSNECGYDMIKSMNMSVKRSSALNNKVSGSVFNSSYKSSFVSNNIEKCTATELVKYSSLGCKVDDCVIKDNDAYLFSFTPNIDSVMNYEILNSEIIGNTKTDMDSSAFAINAFCGTLKEDSFRVFRTIFKDNDYNKCTFLNNYGSFFTIDQCVVDSNNVNIFAVSRFSESHISNSTFADNKCEHVLKITHNGQHYCKGTGATYVNNTLVRNTCSLSLIDGYYSRSTYKNNTIIGNACGLNLIQHYHSSDMIGNIIFGNTYDKLFSGISPIVDEIVESNLMPSYFSDGDGLGHVDYVISLPFGNVMSDCYFDVLSKDPKVTNKVPSNTVNHLKDVAALFDGNYDANSGLFTPVLENKGGFAPVVVLKKCELGDGTSLRFYRPDDVLKDQTGATRLGKTCMGAYEIPDEETGVENTSVVDADPLVNVYTVEGYVLKVNTRLSEAMKSLNRGFYIIGNKKVYISK